MGKLSVNELRYRVDGEIGRLSFVTHRLERDGELMFDSSRDLFGALKTNELYLTRGFKEVAMVYGSVEQSYRKTARLINRMRYQPRGGTPARTLQEQTEAQGERFQQQIELRAEEILKGHKLSLVPSVENKRLRLGAARAAHKPAREVAAAVAECAADEQACQEMLANPVGYEEARRSVNLSVDDVGVKRQKAKRNKPAGEAEEDSRAVRPAPDASGKTKFIHTTVAEVQTEQGKYVLSGAGVVKVLRMVLAFFLANGLSSRQVICFVDGQKSLHLALEQVFGCFRHWKVILDWYHLEKKCSQLTSLALMGKAVRNQTLDQLRALLWDGRVDSAIKYLSGIEPAKIKDGAQMEQLKGYLERSRPHIPCYSVRKKLGLRNSSNRGEKQNDLVVSERQKHNGMSWSETGSLALASLATAAQNQEVLPWFRTGEINFALAA